MSRLILVVDDEPLNVDMLSRRLRKSGYEVMSAMSGPEALEIIKKHELDLVLLDHMMPDMTGRDVLDVVRRTYSAEILPVIMVTAVAESDKIASALVAGANDYITKPIDYQIALARIQSQLSRKDAEKALRQSEQRYALAAKASRDGLWDWDLATGELYYSPRWMEMAGLKAEGVSDTFDLWCNRVFALDQEKVRDCVASHTAGEQDWLSCEYRLQHTDGTLRWMTVRAVITRDPLGRALRISGSQSDVTEEKTRDALTGLANRTALVSSLEMIFLENQKFCTQEQSPRYAVLFLDLDGFKSVNDSLGHRVGDELLCRTASTLVEAGAVLGAHDGPPCTILPARMSGDEFCILLQSETPAEHAEQLAAEVQRMIRLPLSLEGGTVRIACSIGVTVANCSYATPIELLHDADVAMYAAKANGRGQTIVFTPELRSRALDRLNLENDLRDAVTRNEFQLLYQPKVRLNDGSLYGVEALLRWNHPSRGLLQPGEFIPIAEETGCIVSIGQWVLRNACLQVLAWHERYPLEPLLDLSVNLSPAEFCQPDLVQCVAGVLCETGFPPHCLHLEITEGVLFDNLEEAKKTLHKLHGIGVLLDLDDFGCGYSSLRYLNELPFDVLKIDRYFVSSMNIKVPSSTDLIHTILAMATSLGLKVVAEGIETRPNSSMLRSMGCEYGQGYLFSKPLNLQDMEQLLGEESIRPAGEPSQVSARMMAVPA